MIFVIRDRPNGYLARKSPNGICYGKGGAFREKRRNKTKITQSSRKGTHPMQLFSSKGNNL